MESLCEIIGVNVLGDKIRLKIKLYEQKKKLDTLSALGNISGFMNDMKNEANIVNNPDIVSISFDEWKKHKLNIGDIVTIKVEVGK